MTKDPLKPDTGLLLKLGSLVVHAEEFMSPHGHDVDKSAFDTLLASPDVQEWIKEMNAMSMLPLKRN